MYYKNNLNYFLILLTGVLSVDVHSYHPPKLAPKVGTVDKEVRYCYIALDKGFEPFHVKRDLGLTVQCRHLAGSSRAI